MGKMANVRIIQKQKGFEDKKTTDCNTGPHHMSFPSIVSGDLVNLVSIVHNFSFTSQSTSLSFHVFYSCHWRARNFKYENFIETTSQSKNNLHKTYKFYPFLSLIMELFVIFPPYSYHPWTKWKHLPYFDLSYGRRKKYSDTCYSSNDIHECHVRRPVTGKNLHDTTALEHETKLYERKSCDTVQILSKFGLFYLSLSSYIRFQVHRQTMYAGGLVLQHVFFSRFLAGSLCLDATAKRFFFITDYTFLRDSDRWAWCPDRKCYITSQDDIVNSKALNSAIRTQCKFSNWNISFCSYSNVSSTCKISRTVSSYHQFINSYIGL